ncbi:ABC transporter ATP-binding protein [Ammoniphilus resinae]|uniref:Branched-chain amino acid transport system ATP-binding protein n=1 Tax=Ammoniphilus resinae TaxID=861532 RepID=A0ABS4GQL2_9BACL|nr:ABC transporter ATP-binding protein [Ammoniphilus resinae]MBP1932561.1 branched-chain amino acid transport system ATP-binding protein [Ammoniphilus resinae]
MLSVKNINTYYGNIQALKNVSIDVPEGSIVTILGANGAGKTTTMKSIAGLLKPRDGKIEFLGQDVTGKTPDQMLSRGLALVPEGRAILSGMSVLENLEMGAFQRRDKEVKQDLEKVMDRFPILRERRSQLGGTLSGGQQQMLSIARALMSRPKLLLLDEPSMGLAPLIVQDIFRIIQEINADGTTVLLVEQNARQALKIAHHAYVLETGKVVKSGPAQELLHDPSIKEAYLGH